MRAGDVVLLCSDGLTSMISEERIAADPGATPTRSTTPPQPLIDEANEAGGRDNITVVLFRLEEVGADRRDGRDRADDRRAAAAERQAERPPRSQRVRLRPPPRAERAARSARRSRAAARAHAGRAAAGGPPSAPASRRRFTKPVAALLATVIVLFLVGGGGYLATRQLYFIGTNSQGIVTIYRGLPYDLPAGIRLYETYYVSGVPAVAGPGRPPRDAVQPQPALAVRRAQPRPRRLELGRS